MEVEVEVEVTVDEVVLEHHLEEGVDAAAAQLRTQQVGLVALRLLRHPLGQRLLVQSGDGSF